MSDRTAAQRQVFKINLGPNADPDDYPPMCWNPDVPPLPGESARQYRLRSRDAIASSQEPPA